MTPTARPRWSLAQVLLRGSGQVIFMDSARTGALNLLALAWGAWAGGTTWAVLAGALLGLLLATAAARPLGAALDRRAAGLYGFNGLLVGAALPTFMAPTAALWGWLALAALACTAVTLVLERALRRWALPGLTFPFIVTTWAALALMQAWPALRQALPALAAPAWAAWQGPFGVADFGRAVLVSVAQVFFVDDALAGGIFLLALAVHSRAAAALAALGAAAGVAGALLAGADRAAIAHGMWGYTAALTAPAVGCVFGQPTRAALVLALLAAALTVLAQAAATPLAGAAGQPSLTIAFVVVSWAVLLARRGAGGPRRVS